MAIFKKNKKEETKKVSTQEDNELKDEISKAYDEIMSGNKEEKAEEQPQQAPKDDIAFENEVFKSKVKAFKQERNQQNLIAVLKMLSGRKFLLPSVCNVEDPFEKLENGNVRLKEGTVFNPAFLTSSDKKVFLPIFTDEESMVQKSITATVTELLRFMMITESKSVNTYSHQRLITDIIQVTMQQPALAIQKT
mgnify:CR=1 FL=1